MTEIERLLITLIKIPSVSGQEKMVGDFIVSQFLGVKAQKMNVGKNRFNIIVKKGNSKKWLVAHMDTVPGSIPVRVTRDKIFGRGACDNKQSIAASIIVANQLNDINVLFTVGEELDFFGVLAASRHNVCGDADLVIVQEPTNFKIITGQNGIISCTIETCGIEQHSSLSKSDNAIHKLATIVNGLIKKNWTAFNVGVIEGGIAENVVAGSARVKISIRPRDVKEQKKIISELKRLSGKVSINKNILPFRSNLDFPEHTVQYFSEMGFFKNSIQFGAGDIKNAHSLQEHVLRKDLNILPEKLIQLLHSV